MRVFLGFFWSGLKLKRNLNGINRNGPSNKTQTVLLITVQSMTAS